MERFAETSEASSEALRVLILHVIDPSHPAS